MAYYNNNGDGVINPEDQMDEEHYAQLVEYCDTNFDGAIDECELFECMIMIENEWRSEYCPDYP